MYVPLARACVLAVSITPKPTIRTSPVHTIPNRNVKKESVKQQHKQQQKHHHGGAGDKFREGTRTFRDMGKGAWEKGGDFVFGERKWDSKGGRDFDYGYDGDDWEWEQYGYGPYGGYDDKKWEGDYLY